MRYRHPVSRVMFLDSRSVPTLGARSQWGPFASESGASFATMPGRSCRMRALLHARNTVNGADADAQALCYRNLAWLASVAVGNRCTSATAVHSESVLAIQTH